MVEGGEGGVGGGGGGVGGGMGQGGVARESAGANRALAFALKVRRVGILSGVWKGVYVVLSFAIQYTHTIHA